MLCAITVLFTLGFFVARVFLLVTRSASRRLIGGAGGVRGRTYNSSAKKRKEDS